jgi:hypothetical protein
LAQAVLAPEKTAGGRRWRARARRLRAHHPKKDAHAQGKSARAHDTKSVRNTTQKNDGV